MTPCTTQADCGGADAGFFCQPSAAGDATGLCVPQSPIHCASCTTDADCGALGATCVVGQGDGAPACHIDCALAGSAACPADYACAAMTVAGVARALCVPTSGSCADALGGFCDRVTADQPCERDTDAGACTGTRTCEDGRYGACGATTPTCKPSCGDVDPAQCTESFCASAPTTPSDCGVCGNTCAGLGQPGATVTCTAGSCGFACAGESYDVNGSPADGCEVTDSPTGNHQATSASATYLGSVDCDDSDGLPGTKSGVIPSDARVHSPSFTGFVVASGSAPDWFRIDATGGFCYDDIGITLTVLGASDPTCYQLSVSTDEGSWHAVANGSGSANITEGSGSYDDDSDVYVGVSRICATLQPEQVTYSFDGHL